jgi:hypothetical protein
MRMHANLVLAVCGLGGCEALPDALVDAPVSRVDAPPVSQVAYSGSYDVTGTWDLSRPFGPDGIGGVVADLMIDRIVMLTGVPSSLEDEARAAIAGRIRAPIVSHVNGLVPAELLASSPTMVALADLLSDVTYEAVMSFAAGSDPDRFTGGEVIDYIAVTHATVEYPIRMGELLDGAVTIEAGYSGAAIGATTLAVGGHALEINYGQLVALAARDALGVDVFALAGQAWDRVSCPALVDSFTAGGGFTITVAGNELSVSDANLEAGCVALETMLADQALGMFRRDAGMTLGGPVRITAGAAPELDSEVGYGGTITLFPVITPQVTSTFSSAR